MKPLNFVGIDVSAKELVVQIEVNNKRRVHAIFDNTSAGHQKLIAKITKHGRGARVCMEATGVYHFELAVALSNAERIEVMVANPRAVKHFMNALMQRSKTDKADAGSILEYLKCIEFQAWQPPPDDVLELRALSRRMQQLKNEIVREKNRRHANKYNPSAGADIENDIEVNMRHLEKRLALLQNKALKLVSADEQMKKKYDLLISVKGIAEVSSITILVEIMCLPDDMQPEQWVAHAGLDPRAKESGTSLSKPRHISKMGNKHLRTALYMPAWVAVANDPNVKAFYKKLIAAGKLPMQAIVAVMRKLLRCIWGMFKSGEPWQGEKFYQIPSNA